MKPAAFDSYEWSPEGKEVLEASENGESTPVPDVQPQMEISSSGAQHPEDD